MAGQIKAHPRYEVISFRTTKEQKDLLTMVKGQSSMSEFLDLLLTLYLKEQKYDEPTSLGHQVCTA